MNTPRLFTHLVASALVLASASTMASSQSPSDSSVAPRWTTGSFRVEFGADRLGLTALNNTMAANGRAEFDSEVATIGIAGYARFGRLVLGGTGETALPQRKLAAGYINKLWYGSASMDAGFAVAEGSNFLVYPQASLGVRHRVLQMEQGGDFSYDAGVSNPSRGVTMSTWRAIASYGVVAELRVDSRITGPVSLGVRGGYATPLGGGHTSSGESTVSGTPGEESGGYLRFSVGKPIGKRRNVASVLSTVLFPLAVR